MLVDPAFLRRCDNWRRNNKAPLLGVGVITYTAQARSGTLVVAGRRSGKTRAAAVLAIVAPPGLHFHDRDATVDR